MCNTTEMSNDSKLYHLNNCIISDLISGVFPLMDNQNKYFRKSVLKIQRPQVKTQYNSSEYT